MIPLPCGERYACGACAARGYAIDGCSCGGSGYAVCDCGELVTVAYETGEGFCAACAAALAVEEFPNEETTPVPYVPMAVLVGVAPEPQHDPDDVSARPAFIESEWMRRVLEATRG